MILKGPQTVQKAIECEDEIKRDLIHLTNDPEIELKKFLHAHGFPFSLKMDEVSTHVKTYDVIERIVFDDLKQFGDFNIIVQEFSGFFKPEMNCTVKSVLNFRIFFLAI